MSEPIQETDWRWRICIDDAGVEFIADIYGPSPEVCLDRARRFVATMRGWQPIEEAPKDRTLARLRSLAVEYPSTDQPIRDWAVQRIAELEAALAKSKEEEKAAKDLMRIADGCRVDCEKECEALKAALGQWKCPACNGTKSYLQRDRSGSYVINCKKCETTNGLHEIAFAALDQHNPSTKAQEREG